MDTEGSLTVWARALHSQDSRLREEAARQIWLRFADRLRGVVRRRLDAAVLRKAGGDDDLIQSVFARFFAATQWSKGPPSNREELWRALVHFTMCKVVNAAEYYRAKRRDVHREEAAADAIARAQALPDSRLLGPEAQAIARDEFRRLLDVLPSDYQHVLALRLDGYTNAEIAAELGCVKRTLELKMRAIRGLVQPYLDGASEHLHSP